MATIYQCSECKAQMKELDDDNTIIYCNNPDCSNYLVEYDEATGLTIE